MAFFLHYGLCRRLANEKLMTDIVHIISGLGGGGAENTLAQLAPRLAKNGMSQTVISLTGDGVIAGRLEAEGIPVVRLDFRSVRSRASNFIRLLSHIHSMRPKFLQGWMYHGDLAATAAHMLAPGKKNRQLVWGIRCSNMDIERNGKLVRWGAIFSNIPDAVVANSEVGVNVHTLHGYRPRRLEVISNGVNLDHFRPDSRERARLRQKFGLSDDAVVAIHTARVDPMKDHQTLLIATESVRGLNLVLVGQGTREFLASYPNVCGKVQALGRREDIASLLTVGDIIVSSSAYGEGFSNALAEGMAAGLVPVATDVGDSEKIMGDTGILIPPNDPSALAHALTQLVSIPHDDLRRRGLLARKRIKDEFDIKRMTDRFVDLYIDLSKIQM